MYQSLTKGALNKLVFPRYRGVVAIFKGSKPLKMKTKKNRIFLLSVG